MYLLALHGGKFANPAFLSTFLRYVSPPGIENVTSSTDYNVDYRVNVTTDSKTASYMICQSNVRLWSNAPVYSIVKSTLVRIFQ